MKKPLFIIVPFVALLLNGCGDSGGNNTSAPSVSASGVHTASGGAEWSDKIDYLDPKTVVKPPPPYQGKMIDDYHEFAELMRDVLNRPMTREEWVNWLMNEDNYRPIAGQFNGGSGALSGLFSTNEQMKERPFYRLMFSSVIPPLPGMNYTEIFENAKECVALHASQNSKEYKGFPTSFIDYRLRRQLDLLQNISDDFEKYQKKTVEYVEIFQGYPPVFRILVHKGLLITDQDIKVIKEWDEDKPSEIEKGKLVKLSPKFKDLVLELEAQGLIPNAIQNVDSREKIKK